MKVSKTKAAAHRAGILAAAGRLFREKGVEKVGVADITREAGLTHGGFYGHFPSKEALAAESCGDCFDAALERLRGSADLDAYLTRYLSAGHRDGPGNGCPIAALQGDSAHLGGAFQQRFAAGLADYLTAMQKLAGAGQGDDRAAGIRVAAAAVGALTLARAVAAADPALSEEILRTVRRQLLPPPDDAAISAPSAG